MSGAWGTRRDEKRSELLAPSAAVAGEGRGLPALTAVLIFNYPSDQICRSDLLSIRTLFIIGPDPDRYDAETSVRGGRDMIVEGAGQARLYFTPTLFGGALRGSF